MSAGACTVEELILWRQFAAACRAHAEAMAAYETGAPPLASKMMDLRRRCRRIVMPEGQRYRGSAVHELFKLADRWTAAPLHERRELAPDMISLCARVETALNAAAGAPPAPRPRADLEG